MSARCVGRRFLVGAGGGCVGGGGPAAQGTERGGCAERRSASFCAQFRPCSPSKDRRWLHEALRTPTPFRLLDRAPVGRRRGPNPEPAHGHRHPQQHPCGGGPTAGQEPCAGPFPGRIRARHRRVCFLCAPARLAYAMVGTTEYCIY